MTDFVDVITALRGHAARRPDALALSWFDATPEVTEQHTFGDLLARCEGLAGALLARGCRPGQPVILLHPPGVPFFEAFLACLMAGIVPVPAYPPDPLGRGPRLDFVARVCPRIGIRFALTTARYNNGRRLGNVRHLLRRGGKWPDVEWISTDRLSPGEPPLPRQPAPDELAFIQFTSGSTADPRGVAISHGNLMHQLAVNGRRAGMTPESRGVVWLPQYHDFGLVCAFLSSMAAGNAMWMCSPLDFLKRPSIWPEMMHRVRATHSVSPDFGYAHVVRKTTPAQRAGWDLSSMKASASGGEAIRPATLEAFAAAFAPSGFPREALYGGYGQAEHVVGMCGGPCRIVYVDREALDARGLLRPVPADDPRAQALVSSGSALDGVEVRVVDPETGTPLPDGRVGEIWGHSPSVALGYVGDAERTRAVFENRLPGEGDRRWLRTGDLGALLGGEIFVTGRLKELIIVRGRNVQPADVEGAIRGAAHPAVRPGGIAAVGVELDGEEQLAVLVELRDPAAWRGRLVEIGDAVRAIVAAGGLHLARLLLVDKGTLPKTTSGKLQRTACARWLADDALAGDRRLLRDLSWRPAAPDAAAAAEGRLAEALTELPRLTPAERPGAARAALIAWMAALPDTPIDADDPPADAAGLNALGLDSLGVATLLEIVERVTGHGADRGALFEMTTLGRLVAWVVEISAAPRASDGVTVDAEDDRPAPATPFQRLVRRDHGDAPGAVMLFEVDGGLSADTVRRATRAVFERHDLLRARFVATDAGLAMVPGPAPEPRVIEITGPPTERPARLDAALRAPFDIAAPPLLRVALARSERGPTLLGLAVHHLVYDAVSVHALADAWLGCLGAIAGGARPETRPAGDFLAWAQAEAARAHDPADSAWWQVALADVPWPLPVPRDVPVAERWMAPAGRFEVPPAVVERLRALARRCDTTLNAALACGWARSMGAALDVDVVTCAYPVSTRSAATRAVCGPLIDDVLLPLPVEPDADAVDALRRVGRVVREALRHGAAPFEVMAQALDPSGAVAEAGCPVFFAAYDWDRLAPQPAMRAFRRGEPWPVGPLTVRPRPIAPATGPRPFDYFAVAELADGRLTCSLRVNRDRVGADFGARLVETWQRSLIELAAGVGEAGS